MDYLVHHMLRSSTLRAPDGEAVVDGRRHATFAQATQSVNSVAHGLREMGVRRSDRIGVFLDPSLELALALFGISQAGGAFVPIHHSLYPSQIEHIALDCGMVGLITEVKKLAGLADVLRRCPSLRFVLIVGGAESAGRVATEQSQHAWEAWAGADCAGCKDVGLGSDLAAILYTSGSTGRPKGVMLSHANLIAGASIVSEYLEITHRDRLLAALPFSFDAGLNQLTTSIQQGAACVLIKFLFAREVARALAEEAITGLAGVPPFWNLLVQSSSGLANTPLPCLRYITNTGGVLPQETLAQLRRTLPAARVYLMYGLTEAFRSTYLPPEELERRPTSMGKAIPNTEVLVVRENGELAGPGEVGELVHHGPTVSLGYWGRPDLTRQVLRPHPLPQLGDAERPLVCYSGDLVRSDDDGFLYFVGRRDNLIKSAGFRISPTEVEEVLCRSGQVRDAAVVGVPDDLLGQRILGFVTPRDGREVDPLELAAWCATQMPRHMIPRAIYVRDMLPKTSSGKIDYASLRSEASQHAAGGTPISDGGNES